MNYIASPNHRLSVIGLTLLCLFSALSSRTHAEVTFEPTYIFSLSNNCICDYCPAVPGVSVTLIVCFIKIAGGITAGGSCARPYPPAMYESGIVRP